MRFRQLRTNYLVPLHEPLKMIYGAILKFMLSIIVGVVFTYFIYAYFAESGSFSLVLFVLSELLFLLFHSIILQTSFFVATLLVLTLYSTRFYMVLAGEFLLSIYSSYSGFLNGLLLSISLGTIVTLMVSNNSIRRSVLNEERKGMDSGTEIRRDVFQIVTGIIVLLFIFEFGRYDGSLLVLFGSLLLYAVGNFSSLQKNNKVSRFLFTMEREGVSLGHGAISLASGVFFLLGILSAYNVVLVGIFLVLIADPVATIAGKTIGGLRLPYNKTKTVSGTLIALLVSLVYTCLFSGLNLLPYAFIGIMVESITSYPLDDNLTVPISIVLSNYLISIL